MQQPDQFEQQPKCEIRRQQILDAAAECFRRSGFHGASIARISSLAGMSAGHIYHFFANKEAIIAAIVAQKVARSLEMLSRFEAEDDVFAAITNNIGPVLDEKMDPARAGIWLEVLAEAARNPEVAKIVQDADQIMRQRLLSLENTARDSRGITSQLNPEAVTEVVMAMFDGLANRSVQNPDLDKEEVARVMRVALQAILSA
jgi:AcrR family transcriptional regulator